MGSSIPYLLSLWFLLLASHGGAVTDHDGADPGFSIGYAPRQTSKTELRATGWFLLCDQAGVSLIGQYLRERVEDEAAFPPLVEQLPKRWRVRLDSSVELLPAPWTDMRPSATWHWEGLFYEWFNEAGEMGVEGDYRVTQIQVS